MLGHARGTWSQRPARTRWQQKPLPALLVCPRCACIACYTRGGLGCPLHVTVALRLMDPPALRLMDPPALRLMDPPALHLMDPPALHLMDPPALHLMDPPALRLMDPPALHLMDPPALHLTDPPALHLTDPPALHLTGPPALCLTALAFTGPCLHSGIPACTVAMLYGSAVLCLHTKVDSVEPCRWWPRPLEGCTLQGVGGPCD